MRAPDAPVLLVVLGATSAGKSEVAHRVALARGGEILSADAFAVYRGFDIGTAKPSAARRREVPYHLIDVADPSETFSAGRWAREARAIVEDVVRRGRLPIVCGGSGFYIRALLAGLPPGDAADPNRRQALARWGDRDPDGAARMLGVNDPEAAARIAPGNRRYVLRALEILLETGRPASSRLPIADSWADRFRVEKLGIRPAAADLYARIARRVREMLEAGWEGEVRGLLARGVSREANAFEAIGYRELADAALPDGADPRITEEAIVTATRQLAKRQATWFRREPGVVWVDPAAAYATALELLG
jgi:tRNA dimethylallyltransferase